MSAAPLSEGRLRLRPFTAGDRDRLVDMHRDPRVREWLIDDRPFDDPRWTAMFLDRLVAYCAERPGLGLWAAEHWVADLSPGDADHAEAAELLSPEALARMCAPRPRFIGWFNLMPMPADPDEIELGCRLVPEVWGSGLSLEGGALLLDHAFDRLGRARVHAVCHPGHRSVHLCLRSLGFEHRGERFYEGVWSSHFEVEAATWSRSRERPLAIRRREAAVWVREELRPEPAPAGVAQGAERGAVQCAAQAAHHGVG